MWQMIKGVFNQWKSILLIAPTVASLVIVGDCNGSFQLLEWATLDQFFRVRPLEEPDPRIVIVSIDQSDINKLQQWPIPDLVLANLIETIQAQNPRVIGLGIYRDIAIEPGREKLLDVFKTTPNLIGIEKVLGETIAPPPMLAAQDQVGITDMVLDADGKMRRGLMSVQLDSDTLKFNLSVKLALNYLAAEGISLTPIEGSPGESQLGKTRLIPLDENDGGYVEADLGGYQILLNYRGSLDSFKTVSMTEVLEQTSTLEQEQEQEQIFRDRIVLIGATSQRFGEMFSTPYDGHLLGSIQRTPGIIIQANFTSQIISAALDGRPMIRVWSQQQKWLWIILWSSIGAIITSELLETTSMATKMPRRKLLLVVVALGSLLASSYLAFLEGSWLPTISPVTALISSAIAMTAYEHYKLYRLASLDGLTQLANRRYFDQYLDSLCNCHGQKEHLSLILCDVDCFKLFNDTYGHQAGDDCLKQVAQAISEAVRHSDFVARYGGEEFVVILPNTQAKKAAEVAERIRLKVRNLEITHARNQASQYVTLSCGVASTLTDANCSPASLIYTADQALYQAKEQGRDRVLYAIPN
jgi:adenylate cyclase